MHFVRVSTYLDSGCG